MATGTPGGGEAAAGQVPRYSDSESAKIRDRGY
jgi:hypothetical protein